MTKNSDILIVGYDFDSWRDYGLKEPIVIDTSLKSNKHILLSGVSGSGKSYAEQQIFARLVENNSDIEAFFADFKQDDSFEYLRDCPRYFGYKRTIEALDIVYNRLQKRQSGEDTTRNFILLVWDEYVSNILQLMDEDKKRASKVMSKVSEILMLGRSLNIAIFVSVQRPDASVFTSGSRINFGVTVILGEFNRSIYEMLIPDYVDMAREKVFDKGEGVISVNGVKPCFIKIPTVRNVEKMQELCKKALS